MRKNERMVSATNSALSECERGEINPEDIDARIFSILERATLSAFNARKLSPDSTLSSKIGNGRKDSAFHTLPHVIQKLIVSDIVEFLGYEAIKEYTTKEKMIACEIYNKIRERIRVSSRGV